MRKYKVINVVDQNDANGLEYWLNEEGYSIDGAYVCSGGVVFVLSKFEE